MTDARRAVSHALDDIVGVGARALHLVATRNPDTIAEAEVFRGLPLEEVFRAPAGIPEIRARRRWATPWLIGEELRFASSYRPLSPGFELRYDRDYTANHVVHARRVRHVRGGPRPALIYLHGWLQPETPFEEAAILANLASRLGVDVVQLQPPYHGRRRVRVGRFTGDGYFTSDVVRSIEAIRQSIHDARSLLGWLLEDGGRPGPSPRVGVGGVSLGGALTLALTGLDARLDFAIPMIAHLDLGSLVADAPVLHTMRRELRARGYSPDELRSLMGSFGWNDMQPRVDPKRIFLVGARHDKFFDPVLVDALARRWKVEAQHWYPGGHMEIALYLWSTIGMVQRWYRALPG